MRPLSTLFKEGSLEDIVNKLPSIGNAGYLDAHTAFSNHENVREHLFPLVQIPEEAKVEDLLKVSLRLRAGIVNVRWSNRMTDAIKTYLEIHGVDMEKIKQLTNDTSKARRRAAMGRNEPKPWDRVRYARRKERKRLYSARHRAKQRVAEQRDLFVLPDILLHDHKSRLLSPERLQLRAAQYENQYKGRKTFATALRELMKGHYSIRSITKAMAARRKRLNSLKYYTKNKIEPPEDLLPSSYREEEEQEEWKEDESSSDEAGSATPQDWTVERKMVPYEEYWWHPVNAR